MNRDDYIGLLDRALVSAHGVRLEYGDDLTARRVRAKLYHIRAELRSEARTEPCTEPVFAYDAEGKLQGVLDILRHRTPPPTPYDDLRMRVWEGSLYIVPAEQRPRRVDELEPVQAREIDGREIDALPHWPPWSA
jgi:hypothetical protein